MDIKPDFIESIPLDIQLEALLFAHGEPIELSALRGLLECGEEALSEAFSTLEEKLSGRGLALVVTESSASLRTAPFVQAIVAKAVARETLQPLSRAALETVSIVLYYGPVSKARIEQIRGVNSAYVLRALLMRGLIEKVDQSEDGKGFSYQPTQDLLALLGVSRAGQMPEYGEVADSLNAFLKANPQEELESSAVKTLDDELIDSE